MRTGSWDSLSVLKPENTLHLLSHASLPCNDVYIRTCQHAKVIKLLQSLFEQYPGNDNAPPSTQLCAMECIGR
jgi:hypothetical protein